MNRDMEPSRSRLSGAERRDQILASAYRVFSRKGLAGARTREIADEAGVNEALIYQHFRSKSELFGAVLASVLEETTERLAKDLRVVSPDEGLGEEDVLQLMTRQVRQLLAAFADIEPLLGAVLYGEDEGPRQYFHNYLNKYLATSRRTLEAHLPLWDHVEFEPALAVEAVLGIVWMRAIMARLNSVSIDLDRESVSIATLALKGLLVR